MIPNRTTPETPLTASIVASTTGEPPAAFPPSPVTDPVGAGRHLGGPDSPIAVLTLADWRTKGIGPAYVKVGRLIRYKISDLDAWLDSRVKRGA